MALKDVAPILAKEFIPLMLDYDRGIGAKEIQQRYTKKQEGLPWFVFVDGDGKALATSTAPTTGNVGFPYQPNEIAHFKEMLEKMAALGKRLTATDIAYLVKSLEDTRKRLEGK